MRILSEMSPKVEVTTTFSLQCPVCTQHRIGVLIGGHHWQWDGQTLSPSVQFEGGFTNANGEPIQCKGHFTITKGVINVC